jgi:hypothetical protein
LILVTCWDEEEQVELLGRFTDVPVIVESAGVLAHNCQILETVRGGAKE